MASRLPNEDNDEALEAEAAAQAASWFPSQLRDLLAGWHHLAPAVEQANLAQFANYPQNNHRHPNHQQQQTQQQIQAFLAAVTRMRAPGGSMTSLPPALWAYAAQQQEAVSQAALAANPAAGLSPLAASNLATSYLDNLQNLMLQSHDRRHENLSPRPCQGLDLMLQQIEYQRQMMTDPLFMAAFNQTLPPQQPPSTSASPLHQHQSYHHQQSQHQAAQSQAHHNLLAAAAAAAAAASAHSGSPGSQNSSSALGNSHLTTANSGPTNQHQDSLVDQHFRRSLGEDYNQILGAKTDKINVGK